MEIYVIQAGLTEGELTLNAVEALKNAQNIILHTERCGAGEWLKKNNIVNFMLTFKNKEMENVYSQLKINDKGEVYNVNELS